MSWAGGLGGGGSYLRQGTILPENPSEHPTIPTRTGGVRLVPGLTVLSGLGRGVSTDAEGHRGHSCPYLGTSAFSNQVTPPTPPGKGQQKWGPQLGESCLGKIVDRTATGNPHPSPRVPSYPWPSSGVQVGESRHGHPAALCWGWRSCLCRVDAQGQRNQGATGLPVKPGRQGAPIPFVFLEGGNESWVSSAWEGGQRGMRKKRASGWGSPSSTQTLISLSQPEAGAALLPALGPPSAHPKVSLALRPETPSGLHPQDSALGQCPLLLSRRPGETRE